MMPTSLTSTIAKQTAMGLRMTLSEYMSESPYSRYFSWALSEDNPQHEKFWKLIGLSQLSSMTANLVDGILDGDQLTQFLPYVVDMNIYQLYEVVSDNMAIGLAQKQFDDKTFMSRRHLLYIFNLMMIDALEHQEFRQTSSVENAKWLAQHISAFGQSLNYNVHREMACAYTQVKPDVMIEELEHHLWHNLQANIESAIHLLKVVQHHPTRKIFSNTLIERYKGTNLLLAEIPLSLEGLSEIGTNTILVTPTLIYYIGVIAEIKKLNEQLSTLVDSGLLYKVLSQASLLIRILNDLGTDIALAKPETAPIITDVLRDLRSADEFMNRVKQSNQVNVFTRIHKDLIYGEFNIALYSLYQVAEPSAITNTLKRNFHFFSTKYQIIRTSLDADLSLITETLNDPFVEQIILKFIMFHERLYSNDFRTATGEYAI